MSSTWHAHIRIEKGGAYAEYNDLTSALSMGSEEPSEAEVAEYVMSLIINQAPAMKGGRVTLRSVRKVR